MDPFYFLLIGKITTKMAGFLLKIKESIEKQVFWGKLFGRC
jgi:hypothetical protein